MLAAPGRAVAAAEEPAHQPPNAQGLLQRPNPAILLANLASEKKRRERLRRQTDYCIILV